MRQKKSLLFLLIFNLFLCFILTSCGGGGDAAPATNKVAFITSVYGTPKLGDWPDAGGASDLAAGNAICQARATAAGLPGTYRAWISTSTTDAYCNVLGLTGTKSGNCGGVSPLPVAGPWVRTDGTRFAPTLDILTTYPCMVYTPFNYDEFGDPVPATFTVVFTNTDPYGVMWTGGGYNACSDWTDGTTSDWSVAVIGGETPSTGSNWATGYGYPCNLNTGHLICLQTGAGIPLPPVTATGKKVFVTSVAYSAASLGGLTAADTNCTTRANAAGLPGTYTAWLSDSGNDAIDRLKSSGPWVRMDGLKIADNTTDLTDGSLFTSISQNELGNFVTVGVWTGTDTDGTANANTCNDWTDSTISFNGGCGSTVSPAYSWTQNGTFTCNSTQPIYCFED